MRKTREIREKQQKDMKIRENFNKENYNRENYDRDNY